MFGNNNTPGTIPTFNFGSTGTSNTGSGTQITFGSGVTFGQQQPATAAPQPQPSIFGSTSGTGSTMFGSTTTTTGLGTSPSAFPAFGSGTFGSPAASQSPQSSLAFGQVQTQAAGSFTPFKPATCNETIMKGNVTTQVNCRLQFLTCMKEYESKSFEELRLEDYQLNRKGPQQQTSLFGISQNQSPGTGIFTGFGSSAPASNNFFGQTTTSTTTGATGTQPSTGGIFGSGGAAASTATAAPISVFGGGSTTTTGGFSLFGNSTPGNQTQTSFFGTSPSIFAQKPPQQTFSLFNTDKASTTTAPTAPTAFGTASNNSANKSIFGGFNNPLGTATTNTAATTSAPSFGSGTGGFFTTSQQPQQPAKPFTFSNPLGSTTQPQAPTLGGSTGVTSNVPTFNFSKTATAPKANANPLGTAGGTQFSFTPQQPQPSAPIGAGFTFNTSGLQGGPSLGTGFSFQNQSRRPVPRVPFQIHPGSSYMPQGYPQQFQHQNANAISFATSPFKDNPLFYNLIAQRNIDEMCKPTSRSAQRRLIDNQGRERDLKSATRSSSTPQESSAKPINRKVPWYPFNPIQGKVQSQIFDGFEEDVTYTGESPLAKNEWKKLVIKEEYKLAPDPGSKPGTYVGLMKSGTINLEGKVTRPERQKRHVRFSDPIEVGHRMPDASDSASFCPTADVETCESDVSLNVLHHPPSFQEEGCQYQFQEDGGCGDGIRIWDGPPPSKKPSTCKDIIEGSESNAPGSLCGVICTRPGYYIKPSLEELDKLVDKDGNCVVPELEIGRVNFGRIIYREPVNVKNVNVDKTMAFKHKEVVVFPDTMEKPPFGQGLNHPAEVQLERVWPVDKSTLELVRPPDADYVLKLRKACERMEVEFLNYNPEDGVWTFKVDQF